MFQLLKMHYFLKSTSTFPIFVFLCSFYILDTVFFFKYFCSVLPSLAVSYSLAIELLGTGYFQLFTGLIILAFS